MGVPWVCRYGIDGVPWNELWQELELKVRPHHDGGTAGQPAGAAEEQQADDTRTEPGQSPEPKGNVQFTAEQVSIGQLYANQLLILLEAVGQVPGDPHSVVVHEVQCLNSRLLYFM